MVISGHSTAIENIETPLLNYDTSANEKGHLPVPNCNKGGWRSAYFLICVEVAERVAYKGVGCNLVNYLTGPMGQSMATAVENVNAWLGAANLLPLIGAFVGDSLLGRYRTILVSSLLYILGLGLLTLSAMLPPISSQSNKCNANSQQQVILLFFSLYLVALAQSGHKPCIQAFGGDQFDEKDPEECKAKSSFFNWWYFGIYIGTLIAVSLMSYIQDNLSWVLGFGIPCLTMVISLAVFLVGTPTYKKTIIQDKESPFIRIGRVFVAAFRNRQKTAPSISATQNQSPGTSSYQSSQQFKFLNKALFSPAGRNEDGKLISMVEVEEAKAILRLIPIWITSLMYSIVYVQQSTLFTKQGATMERTIWSGFNIPAASLQSIINFSNILLLPIYDRIFVPTLRSFTGKPSGITMLQRIGIGELSSAFSMVVAALVEMKRLEIAKEHDLVDIPNVTIPMSVWWLVPQYLLFGIAEILTLVGLQELFYSQVPNEIRSVGIAFYISVIGVGSILSTFLISTIDKATSGIGHHSWFSNNLNQGHLDYFYWLIAGLSAISLVAYMFFARSFIYK